MTHQDFLDRFEGIRWIGDIHGHPGIRAVVTEARAMNYAVGFIGDLTDQCPTDGCTDNDSADVIRLLIELDAEGSVILTPGNHCNKLLRYFTKLRAGKGDETKIKQAHGMAQTIEEIMSADDSDHLIDGFIRIVSQAYVWNRFGRYVFVHGGGSAKMFEIDAKPLAEAMKDKSFGGLLSRAMYGETDGTYTDGFPTRLYTWVDRIPEGKVIVMGHDKRKEITIMEGKLGGQVILIDTGAGKGGKLSWLDMEASQLR